MTKVGIYARYSSVDILVGEDSQSRSIKNQIDILTKYANEHNFKIYKVYSDYHKSGAEMDRPGLQELLTDASEGKLNTILVKDLSRFGRNYMEVGNYIDNIFPSFGIRFISVNDNYDSLETKDDLAIALKNFINHLYSKDASKKIRKSMMLRAEKEPIISQKFGYDINKKVIKIDEDAANTIKFIYKKAQEGINPYQISKLLNEKNILCPSNHAKKLRGDKLNNTVWNSGMVSKILRDESYTGKFTNFIYRKGVKNRDPENAKAIVVDIPQIITQDEFEKTPKFYMSDDSNFKLKIEHLSSMVRCNDCIEKREKKNKKVRGQFLVLKELKDGNVYYICNQCNNKILASKLETKLYKDLVSDIKKINSNREEYINKLAKELGAVEKNKLSSEEVNLKMKTAFEDYLAGKISFKDYQNVQNTLATNLLYGSFNMNLKNGPLTIYNLRNKVIRYLNSINLEDTDHIKFIKDNILEANYSFEKNKFTFKYPFMK